MPAVVTPEIWRQAKSIFDRAASLPVHERSQLVDSADEEVGALVARLLRDHDRARTFLESGLLDPAQMLSVAADAERPLFAPGEVVAERFRIERQLGSGGMGDVYEAADLVSREEHVALKTIRSGLCGDSRLEAQLRQEVNLARKVTHSNVSRVYEFFVHESTGESPGRLCLFSMELLSGETLRDVIHRRGAIPAAEAVLTLTQVAEGLAAAHHAGVVHGDLKTGNIIVTTPAPGKASRAVVTDFGLAKSLHHSEQERGLAGGTLSYMAPEQLTGQPASQASDVYAFGLVAFEAVTGQLPEPGVITGSPESLRKIRRHLDALPPVWRSVVARCLHPDARQRYASASEVPAALAAGERGSHLKRRTLAGGALALVGAGAAWMVALRFRPQAQGPMTLAVFPFEWPAAQPEAEYFADGVTDEVIVTLGRASGFRVLSRNSTFRYKTKQAGQAGAAALHADMVLAGSVSKHGGMWHANVRLSADGGQREIWSTVLQAQDRDGYRLPREIAALAAQQMRSPLAQRAGNERKPPSPAAYESYLRGLYFRNKHASESVRRALDCFEQAVSLQPDFAEAWAALGESYQFLAGTLLPVAEASAKARHAATRALELDDRLALAHQTRGSVSQRLEWDWKSAEREFETGVRLEPSNARIHHVFAGFLSDMGRHEEAVQEIELARRLDPLSVSVNTGQAIYYYFARRYDDAIRQGLQVLELEPNYFRIFSFIGHSHLAKGEPAKAMEYFERGHTLAPSDVFLMCHLAIGCFRAGQAERGRKLLARVESLPTVHPFYVALIYGQAGDRSAALAWLERGFQERDPSMTLIKVHPLLDNLRNEPRLQRLIVLMKLA